MRTFGDRGLNAPESIYGADICLIMKILEYEKKDSLLTEITKGLLIQSKMHKTSIEIIENQKMYLRIKTDTALFKEIQTQCLKMKQVTPDSYLLVYNDTGFYVIRVDRIIKPPQNSKSLKVEAGRFEDFLPV